LNTIRSLDPLARRPEAWKLEEWLKANKYPVEEVRTVFDLGSRDCIEAVELARIFPKAKVVAVECNPECLKDCYMTLEKHLEDAYGRIWLVPKSVNSWTGRCRFWAINSERTLSTWIDGNLGASSMLKANGDYPIEKYEQDEIVVDCMTLDDLYTYYAVQGKTIIWQDLQGFEKTALESGSHMLKNVDLIYSEISYKPAYEGQCMAWDMRKYLHDRGYKLVAEWPGEFQGDGLWMAE